MTTCYNSWSISPTWYIAVYFLPVSLKCWGDTLQVVDPSNSMFSQVVNSLIRDYFSQARGATPSFQHCWVSMHLPGRLPYFENLTKQQWLASLSSLEVGYKSWCEKMQPDIEDRQMERQTESDTYKPTVQYAKAGSIRLKDGLLLWEVILQLDLCAIDRKLSNEAPVERRQTASTEKKVI